MNNIVDFPGLGLHFEFYPYIHIGPITIAYYGMIIGFGMLLAFLYANKTFKKVGVDKDKAIDAIIGGVIGGVVGARLYYVAFAWDDFKDDLGSIFSIKNGGISGLAIYGGLIGALVVGLIVAKWRKIKIAPLLDVVGIGFLLGQGIGRWGNFFNVEAFGSNTNLPWGMTSPSVVSYLQSKVDYFDSMGIPIDPFAPVHPCFLYESIWCIVGFFVLNAYLKHRRFDGEVFIMYLGYYGLARFFIEGLRTDSLMMGSLRVSRLLSGLLFVASVITIIVIRSHIKGKNDKDYMKLFVNTPEGIAIANGETLTNKKEETTIKEENKDIEEVEIQEDNISKTKGDEDNG